MPSAASLAKRIDANGELYQRRALLALAILVRQAWAAQPIFYSDAATELAMDNPRNMDFVLGSVGNSIRELARQWGDDIPPLQAIAINKATGLPGEGFAGFAPDPAEFRSAPLRVKRQILNGLLAKVYSYPRWRDVLTHFGASIPAAPDLETLIPTSVRVALGSGVESEMHKGLKEFLARSPQVFGLGATTKGVQEYCFPSSDRADILFATAKEWVVVEVKSRISPEYDIVRGLFQCVKYQALLDAVVAVERHDVDTRVVLALESELPQDLQGLVNSLGVTVMEKLGSIRNPT